MDLSDTARAILPTITDVDGWLAVAQHRWKNECEPVHLVFSPGDGTCYAMVFVPPGVPARVTLGEHRRCRLEEGVIALLTCSQRATAVNMDGAPYPDYVDTHLGLNGNPWSIAAIGVVWMLMVGQSPEHVAAAYQGHAAQILEWNRDTLT